ncbi:helix-turn-helix domain-containing protein [Flaviflexus ciconiae]|uniref:helix-turn-helix domain-containing protein n=1 Tax=Flaviflexus ciconiae TaxID=2496867 RepID=UPI00269DC4D5
MLYCPVCDLTRTPDEVEALTKWRAASADLSVRPREAAKLLGIPEQTVYAWVRRGLLNRRDGLVSLADVASVRKEEKND